MNFVHFIQLLLVCGILIAVGVPLFRGLSKVKLFTAVDPEEEAYKHLLVRKEEVLLSIKDLEFEYQTDKVSTQDYHETREKLEVEAASILQKLDELEQKRKKAGKQPSHAHVA
ncbi:MAG: hypothetical protein GWM98_07740 [Nitrospinaceae bacterium]|nr:hypothetical protein [Nitrospinaceae bacterium]NIR54411.1 hypothetical protein [Nitrospinaceae bacterium]NIS84825.1 hypothetical protein [Nitrospinaceae bacterium]NIT81630.1 hypothetical protein [Nitrospinaceae bacterium]NIU43913.1 hypothetical protein [Nitrospinaceae bacterium]